MSNKQLPENHYDSTKKLKGKQNNIIAMSQAQNSTSPMKYLLQNNIKFNESKEGDRGQQELLLISKLLSSCKIFQDLEISLEDTQLFMDLCKGVVLIYCESPHIMEIKDNQAYVFLQGQGFEYMQSNVQEDYTKFRIYDKNEYLMLRKLSSNDYFLSLQEYNGRYHVSQKKYQLMVDENTLLGKISDQTFHKIFFQKIVQKQKHMIKFIQKVQIFTGLPNSFFHQFSKFLIKEAKKQGEKVLTREQKSKYVYLIQEGEVEVRHFNDQKTKSNLQPYGNYYVANLKLFNVEKLAKFSSFGMEQLEMLQALVDKEVICLTDCIFYKIQKRLLAIIITSFQIEFQSKSKVWSQININNQIKGQNYTSPQKQLLSKNVERIRTTQKKSRDLRLRFLAQNKKKADEEQALSIQKQKSLKEIVDENLEIMSRSKVLSPEQKRRMIKTQEGRFRTTSIIKFINNFQNILQNKQDLTKHQLINQNQYRHSQDKIVSQIEIVQLDGERQKQVTLPLRLTNAFQYKSKLQNKKFSRTISHVERIQSTSKFVPKIQPKIGGQSLKELKDKYNSDMIGVFLDKKIKNQIVKKAEKVSSLNKNLKLIEHKNIKRLFSVKDYKAINAISEIDKKSIAQDIVARMTNLRDNPLLLQIQSERRKVERQLKLAQKQSRTVESSPKKYKKQDELILIKNQD